MSYCQLVRFSTPHRVNTFQTPMLPLNNSHPHRHRLSAHDPGMSQHRPSRTLLTTAPPPDQQSASVLSPLSLEPPVPLRSAPVVPSPPPTSSILFSQTLTPPLTTVQSSTVTPPNISSVLSSPSGTVYMPRNSISPLGVGPLADDVVGTLQSVLLTPGADVNQLSLQAVVQGRPDADYQNIVNALIKLHQQQQQHCSLMKNYDLTFTLENE